MDLSPYDGKRIAIVMRFREAHHVLRGRARYIQQQLHSNQMRIALDGADGNPEFVIHENQWDGVIQPDNEFGCDYWLEVARG